MKNVTDKTTTDIEPKTKYVSSCDFYAYMLMTRKDRVNYLHLYRELFLQFVVDMYAKVESEKLAYIRTHQTKLRAEKYVHLQDEIRQGTALADIGKKVILPSSFVGGPRYMHQRTQDAMTYVTKFGRPDLFVTFTCNPKWDEIQSELHADQKAHHRPDIVARVFNQKLKVMMSLLKEVKVFGELMCWLYTVEWQKRGLPHAHILLWMKEKIKPSEIDTIISAELPDKEIDPILLEVVKAQMVHEPCGSINRLSPCMVNDGKKCSKDYPRKFVANTQTGNDGYPTYRRRMPGDGGFETTIGTFPNEKVVDNRWIVPYSPLLCKIFKAHINVEFCNSIKSIKYVCKYVNKGTDMAMVGLRNQNDETEIYQQARYISSNEAV